MGKKYNEFTEEEKEKMLNLHNDGVLNRELADIFNTSTTMISRLLCSMDIVSRHPMLSNERKLKIKECYEENKNMAKVAKIMKCSESTVSHILKEFGITQLSMSEVKRQYLIDENYFNIINTQNKAYSLGFIFADGSVNKNGSGFAISIQERDKELLDKLNHEFGGDRKLSFIEYNKKNHNWQNQYCLAITNQKMNQDLIKHGAVPNKSLSLEFPNDISNDLIRHFVRGYFDGDGSLAKNEDRCTIISTENFCKSLSDIIANELNIHCSIMLCHGNKDKPTRTIQIAGKKQVKKFLDWLYFDAELYLGRKHSLYLSKYYQNTNNSLSA